MVWRRELGVLAVNWSDILDGEIVNAAWAVAGMIAKPRSSRRAAADLDTAVWSNTERLIREALAEVPPDRDLPDLSAGEAAELEAAVRTPEVQGALQALLAARLTDAPEADAARARGAVRLALLEPAASTESRVNRRGVPTATFSDGRGVPPLPAGRLTSRAVQVRCAEVLSEYLDDKICGLVGTLEGKVGFAGLAQVRAEAYNARIVALLGAIERQVAALADPARGTRAEAEFLHRYRRQAHQRHGFLTPPDFDRRRRIPVADIYVPTDISEDAAERMRLTPDTEPASLKVWGLTARLDRTVLLGDPGGGKTTAANVLTDHFAADGSPRVAFLVTLREYAAKTPIEWSVAEHIEHNLSTLYQSPAPDGLVERLLLTGRAVVIFDGLDELLDTSRRRDVSDRVEQFCSAYPLTPVLVTSRVVGYDQARLDDTQFTCYRLGGFGDDEVAEYASKWFRSQEGLAAAEAAAKASAFLGESSHAADLRANPLLLSLMCILYRGAGSLPGDRAGIYARCAELMLRKWDEQRDLYRKFGSDHLVEPTLRRLAWWLFTREEGQTAATEHELIAEAADFLHERGYETEEQARAAAREFVEFCRGRMWVFSDAGTTADGEKLYGFTHRTFLEYFAAWHLAVTSESPEELAQTLAPRIVSAGWRIVAELAIRMTNEMSDRGADRVYAALLSPELTSGDSEPLLEFLASLVASVRPGPGTIRVLTRAVLDYVTGCGKPLYASVPPLGVLLFHGTRHRHLIAEELSARVAAMVTSGDALAQDAGLRLALTIPFIGNAVADGEFLPLAADDSYWLNWSQEQKHRYAAEIAASSVQDKNFRMIALHVDAISARDALAMPGGLSAFMEVAPLIFEKVGRISIFTPYFGDLVHALRNDGFDLPEGTFSAIGQYALDQAKPPWIRMTNERVPGYQAGAEGREVRLPALDDVGILGVAVVLCVAAELQQEERKLPALPLPAEFRQMFADWADGKVSFVELEHGEVAV